MKSKATCLLLLLSAIGVWARMIPPFISWNYLSSTSPYIAVVKCGKPTPSDTNVFVVGGPRNDTSIQIVITLKGTNFSNPTRLQTDHDLCPGRDYLVFGVWDADIFRAYEEYRVVPLGSCFPVSLLAGKALDDQIQLMLKLRLDDMNRKMKENEEEKKRLEAGIGNQ